MTARYFCILGLSERRIAALIRSLRAAFRRSDVYCASVRQLNLIVAEDNEDFLELLKLLLEREGHTVRGAQSAKEAGSLLALQAPDLLLCDLGLPDLSGFEFARQVRASHPDLPLIAMSGFCGADTQKESQSAGFSTCLSKPISATDLANAIEKHSVVRKQLAIDDRSANADS